MLNLLASPTSWILILGSFLAAIALTPFVIRLARKTGAIDHGGYRKINRRSVPRLGGLAIAFPFLLICFLGIFHPRHILSAFADKEKEFLLMLLGGGAIVALGVVDDIHNLRARWKFVCQIAVAILMVLGGKGITSIHLPIFGLVHCSTLSGALLTIAWIVGVINAINLVDGIDGLASGLALIASIGLGTIAALNGQPFTATLCLGLTGALAGFLCFNFNPARIFLGDTGSMFLGYALAMLALTGSSRTAGSVMLAPILVLGFPIFDTITSMGRRILRGRNPFVGDRAHTHHRLLDYGYTQRQVALILYGVALLCTLSAILFQVFEPRAMGPLLALGMYTLVLGAVAWANGFFRLRHILRVALCRERNTKLASFSQYATLALKEKNSTLSLDELLRLGCRELNLNFLEIGPDVNQTLAGYYGEHGAPAGLPRRAGDKIRVSASDGSILEVRYQINHQNGHATSDEDARESAKLERQDIMACLASIFHGIPVGHLVEEPQDAGDGKMAVVRDMSDLVAALDISVGVGAASASADGE